MSPCSSCTRRPGPRAGELERWVAEARASLAERQRARLPARPARRDVRDQAGRRTARHSGAAAGVRREPSGPTGSSCSAPARSRWRPAADRRAFVAAAGRRGRARSPTTGSRPTSSRSPARATSRHCRTCRPTTPCRAGWPRLAGYEVGDLRRVAAWRGHRRAARPRAARRAAAVRPAARRTSIEPGHDRLGAVASGRRRPRAELVVAGRTSAPRLAWLERRSPPDAGSRRGAGAAHGDRRGAGQRPPRSVLGALLDRDGPASLGRLLAELGDGALVDSRVLLAHRYGADERRGPAPRIASPPTSSSTSGSRTRGSAT